MTPRMQSRKLKYHNNFYPLCFQTKRLSMPELSVIGKINRRFSKVLPATFFSALPVVFFIKRNSPKIVIYWRFTVTIVLTQRRLLCCSCFTTFLEFIYVLFLFIYVKLLTSPFRISFGCDFFTGKRLLLDHCDWESWKQKSCLECRWKNFHPFSSMVEIKSQIFVFSWSTKLFTEPYLSGYLTAPRFCTTLANQLKSPAI